MSTPLQAAAIIAVVAVITFLTRLAPFALFGGKHTPPKAILYLGRVLPPAIMAALVIYCIKSISFASVGGFLPQILCVALVAVLHKKWHNTPLSILAGTACYMLLVQLVF